MSRELRVAALVDAIQRNECAKARSIAWEPRRAAQIGVGPLGPRHFVGTTTLQGQLGRHRVSRRCEWWLFLGPSKWRRILTCCPVGHDSALCLRRKNG